MNRYLQIARTQRRLLAIGIGAGIVAGIASGFGVPFFVQKVFRQIFEDSETAYSLHYLIGIACLLPGVFLIRGIAGYINQYFLQWTVQNVLLEIRRQLFDKLQSLPIAYFEKRQTGDLMAKLVGDTLQVQQAALLVARDAFVQPFTFLAGLSYLIYLSVRQQQVGFLLLMLCVAPLMVLPVRIIGRHLRHRSRMLQETLGRLSDIMAENLRGIVEVRSFNLQGREKSRFMGKLQDYNRFAMKMAKYYHITQPFMELLAVSMVSIAFLYSYQEGIGFSAFAALGAALFFSIDAVKRITKLINGLQRVSGSFERIETVLTEEDPTPEVTVPTILKAPVGNLAFEGVRFSYDADNGPDLEVENLDIPLGTVCALVGPSGAGKSTFAKLIPRFYDPQVGRILFDGVDLKQLSKQQLRDCVAFVPQAPVLFEGSVYENILLARPEATEADVLLASQQAQAEEFIVSLPQSYSTHVGENGVRLSGGQRQRIALARAFLKNAPILILDEATSALDAESEIKVQEALKTLTQNRTVLIIAHRFATIRLASNILLFEKGHIRNQGDFDTIMRDPLFKRLHEMQVM
jgi:subfamily B ATP-binding cassette protein MsbA